ncbi:MAG TPA: hypothetical protein VED18_03855 [Candidatus Sulfotelmatobacter sp.]|nr:hypothetical protein [Candidatus Sulfotelmatobacter sp.]
MKPRHLEVVRPAAWARSTLYDQAQVDALNRIAFRFVRCALVYFALGVTLGGLMFLGLVSLPAFLHVHLNLFGFVLMLVFGMVFKLVPPMFVRRQGLYSLGMARAQFWLANLGLIGMLVTYALPVRQESRAVWAAAGASALAAVAACYLFVINVYLTLRGAGGPETAPADAAAPGAPS